MSSWCKLHDEEFKCEQIPVGALACFKPRAARQKEQSHKYDPKRIPGIFVGYGITPGVKWSCQYRVWAASDMTKQNYSVDAEHVIEKLRHLHLTERIEMHVNYLSMQRGLREDED